MRIVVALDDGLRVTVRVSRHEDGKSGLGELTVEPSANRNRGSLRFGPSTRADHAEGCGPRAKSRAVTEFSPRVGRSRHRCTGPCRRIAPSYSRCEPQQQTPGTRCDRLTRRIRSPDRRSCSGPVASRLRLAYVSSEANDRSRSGGRRFDESSFFAMGRNQAVRIRGSSSCGPGGHHPQGRRQADPGSRDPQVAASDSRGNDAPRTGERRASDVDETLATLDEDPFSNETESRRPLRVRYPLDTNVLAELARSPSGAIARAIAELGEAPSATAST